MSASKRSRRQFTAEQKVALLQRHLVDKEPVTCSPDHIVEVTKALGEVTRVAEDPTTNVKTYDVKLPDGATVKVMERVDPTKTQWVTDLRGSR